MKKKLQFTGAAKYVNGFTDYLFGKDYDRLYRRTFDLIEKNHEAGGSPDGFLYEGVYYNNLRATIFSKGKRGNLMPSMEPAMKQYLDDRKKIESDRAKVRQTLTLLILPCETKQDIRDVLPEILVENIPDLAALPRIREEAFTLTTELHRTQYNEFKDLISIYLVSRMFL